MARVAYFVLTALVSLTFCFPCTVSADWTRRVAGSQGIDAVPTGIGIDDAGNVYVAGRLDAYTFEPTFVLFKYDAQGKRKWLIRRQAYTFLGHLPTIAVDGDGSVYLLGGSRSPKSDMITIKYDADGNQCWIKRFFDDSSDMIPGNIAADEESVYVTGSVDTWNGEKREHKIATIKYDKSGSRKWTAQYQDPENARLMSSDITMDAQGNVYVGGYSCDHADGAIRFVTLKYGSDGSLQWKRIYQNAQPNVLNSMAVDSSGNVYRTGYRLGTGGRFDLVTFKYDTLGARQWIRKYNGLEDPNEKPRDMTVDADGNVYVTGLSWRNDILLFETFTIKYDTNGVRKWRNAYEGEGGFSEEGLASSTPRIAVDGDGNVYLTSNDDSTGAIATVKINSNGIQDWVKTSNAKVIGALDFGQGIVLDAIGNIYTIGVSTGQDRSDDIVTIKYEQ